MKSILSSPCQAGAASILARDVGKLFRTQSVPREKHKEARLTLPRCVQGNIACQRPDSTSEPVLTTWWTSLLRLEIKGAFLIWRSTMLKLSLMGQ